MMNSMEYDNPTRLVNRHEGHSHKIHSKFGYILFGITVFVYLLIGGINLLQYKKWLISKRLRIIRMPLWISIGFWAIITAILTFVNNPISLGTIAHRIGRLCFVYLPFTIMITLKPSPLPYTFYLKLVPLHKWMSRFVVLLGTLHGILFSAKWIKESTPHKFFKFLNFLGIITLLLWFSISIVSLKPIRQRFYTMFYTSHYLLSWISILMLGVHSRPGVIIYALICVFVLLGQMGYRRYISKELRLHVISVSPTLSIVKIDRDFLPKQFIPGSHIRLSGKLSIISNWLLPSHPYTIASIPSDEEASLVIRKSNYNINSDDFYTIWSTFPSISQEMINSIERSIIIAGGSGISFAAPIYRTLLLKGIPVELIWVTKNKLDKSILEHLKIENAKVYITSEDNPASNSGNNMELQDIDIENATENPFEPPNEVESVDLEDDSFNIDSDEEDGQLLGNEVDDSRIPLTGGFTSKSTNIGIQIYHGRPFLQDDIRSLSGTSRTKNDNSLVFSCGPEGLVNEVAKICKREKLPCFKEIYQM